MHDVNKPRFRQLRFRQWSGDAKYWLVRKENSALGHCVNFAGKAKAREVVQEIPVKATCLLQPIDFLGRERQTFKKIQRLFETSCDEKSPPRWKLPHEKFEHRRLRLAMIQIGLDHVELIKVGQ